MRLFVLTAAYALLAAAPALAGERGGGYPGGPCCAPPPPPCCSHDGGSRHVSIEVSTDARAYAEVSSQGYARAYEVEVVHGGQGWGYYGGGYGAEFGGHSYGYGYGPVYYDIDPRVLACASAPFGYVVEGFGRDGRRPPTCGGRTFVHEDYGYDRGGRYGYSERRDGYAERSYEVHESYEAYGEAYGGWEGHAERRDCCRERAPYPPAYLPEPPRRSTERAYRPRREAPPRQVYRQEPGERG